MVVSRRISLGDNKVVEEELSVHIGLALSIFERCKDIYVKRLSRIAGVPEEVAYEAIKRAIALHDIGKIHKRFQEIIKKDLKYAPLRHEALSAFIAYFGGFLEDLPEDLKKAVFRAILLHHRPRIVGRITCDYMQYKLTRTLFSIVSGIPLRGNENYKKFIDDLEETDIIDVSALKERLKRYTPDDIYRGLEEILGFGKNPREKAMISIILNAIIDADRGAARIHKARLLNMDPSEVNREFYYAHSKVIDAIREVFEGFEVEKIRLEPKERVPRERREEEFAVIETIGYSPEYDTLFLFGLLEVLGGVDGYVEVVGGYKYRVFVPKEKLEELKRDREGRVKYLLRSIYDAFYNIMNNLGFSKEARKIVEEGAIAYTQPLAPIVGGTYIRVGPAWSGKSGALKKALGERVKNARGLKEIGGSIESFTRLTAIGFTLYTPKLITKNRDLYIAYPLLRPGKRYTISELRSNIATNLTFSVDNVGASYLPPYAALLYFLTLLAPSIDLDELDFILMRYEKGSNRSSIRGGFLLSATETRKFLADLMKGVNVPEEEKDEDEKKEEKDEKNDKNKKRRTYVPRNVNEVCRYIKNLIILSPDGIAKIVQGLEERDVGLIYAGSRILLSELVKNSDVRLHRFAGRFIRKAADRVSRK